MNMIKDGGRVGRCTVKKGAKKLVKNGRRISSPMVYASAKMLKHEVFLFLMDAGLLCDDATLREDDLFLGVFVKSHFEKHPYSPETGLEVLHKTTAASKLKCCILDDISGGGVVGLPLFPCQLVILQASIFQPSVGERRMWTFHLLDEEPPRWNTFIEFTTGYSLC